MQCGDQRGLVAAGRFEDDLDADARRRGRLGLGQQAHDAGVIFFGVVQAVGDAAQVKL